MKIFMYWQWKKYTKIFKYLIVNKSKLLISLPNLRRENDSQCYMLLCFCLLVYGEIKLIKE